MESWLKERFEQDYKELLKKNPTPTYSEHFPFDSDAWPIDETLRISGNITYRNSLAAESLWDQAVNLPSGILQTSVAEKIVPRRFINKTCGRIQDDLATIGFVNGKLNRPENNPFIVDLYQLVDGWKLRKLSHALAHLSIELSGEHPSEYERFIWLKHYDLKILGEIVFCYIFNLPFNIKPRSKYSRLPSIAQYGIDIYYTKNEVEALLKVPMLGLEAPINNKSIVQILVSTHVEPTPVSMTNWRLCNNWSCSPSIVSFRGFGIVDFVVNSRIVKDYRDRFNWVVCEDDLYGFDNIGYLFKALVEEYGVPEFNKDNVDLKKYINSEACVDLILKAPQLPCCLHRNRNDKQRELLKYPNRFATEEEVKSYRKTVRNIKRIIKQACIFEDAMHGVSLKKQNQDRKLARKNYAEARKTARKKEKVIKVRMKEMRGIEITNNELEFLQDHIFLLNH